MCESKRIPEGKKKHMSVQSNSPTQSKTITKFHSPKEYEKIYSLCWAVACDLLLCPGVLRNQNYKT